MPEISVVHLVWAPLGPAALARFLASYRAHPADLPHRLTLVLKGFGKPEEAAEHLELLEGIEYDSMFYDLPTLDLPAYAAAARALDASHICFLNSESVILTTGWLRALSEALAGSRVGIVGATASYERPHSLIPARRRRWPRFPNPHLRTNAFMLSRELMLSASVPDVDTKSQAWELESGNDGLTRQVWRRGLESCVVGRDGTAYQPHEWPSSATFRSGGQANLLVADNRTREWDEADASQRAYLTRLAWGPDPAAAAGEVLRATAPSIA